MITDLYCLKIVGRAVQPREDKKIAATLMPQAVQAEGHGRVRVGYSDSGYILTSKDMSQMFARCGVRESLLCPSVGNGSTHCESVHRTNRHHRLGLPVYQSVTQAEQILSQVIETHDTTDYRSGIAHFLPTQAFRRQRGNHLPRTRQATMGRYYAPPSWAVQSTSGN